MVTYTVSVCNYNMAGTLERSLRSILDQVDDRFEVLVVDDGSTDGSIGILESLSAEFDGLRYVVSDNDNVGAARAEGVRRANGEYVLTQMDADDVYDEGVLDFVTVYHELERGIDREFYLNGHGINVAPRSLLLDIPYRSLGYGEDRDLWRRLLAADALVRLDHEPFNESVGYDRGLRDRVAVTYEITEVEFRSGVTFESFLRDRLRSPSPRSLLQLAFAPVAFANAVRAGRYEQPPGFERMGALDDATAAARRTLPELEAELGIEVDRTALSPAGRRIFYGERDGA